MGEVMSMRLADLNASFLGAGGEGVSRRNAHGEMEPAPRREGVGVILDCPCGDGSEDHRLFVMFANPLDGEPAYDARGWQRTGDTIDTLTLSPSVFRRQGCGWHGWIKDGEAVSC